ncbi:hypothetical protein DAI22_11g146800 [Oryza sativa Japonica Group]|nr:hypothetical protein DAI22_11g146800 [Oryza sativa Japonica Group]
MWLTEEGMSWPLPSPPLPFPSLPSLSHILRRGGGQQRRQKGKVAVVRLLRPRLSAWRWWLLAPPMTTITDTCVMLQICFFFEFMMLL